MIEIEALANVEIFAALDPRERQTLASVLIPHKKDPGEFVFHQGDKGFSCFVILAGAVDVEGAAARGRRRLATLETGAMFGEVALLDHGRRSATCLAGPHGAVLAELRSPEFDMIFGAGNSFAYKLLDMIAVQVVRNLRSASTQLRNLASEDAMRAVTDA